MGKFRALERADLTRQWTVEERAALAFFMEERKVPEGDPIFLKQSQDRCLYLVESGLVKIQYEQFSIDLKEGATFGELSLSQATPKMVTATAGPSCHLWCLSLESFTEMQKTSPLVALKLVYAIQEKVGRLVSESMMPPRILSAASQTSLGAGHHGKSA
jgi:CRP-like cAMP-binding protein